MFYNIRFRPIKSGVSVIELRIDSACPEKSRRYRVFYLKDLLKK